MSMLVRRAAFRLLSGTPRGRYDMTGGSPSTSRFCAECGLPTRGENTSRPAIVVVRAGSLDDTSWLSPVGPTWTRSAQPWLRFDNVALCFQTQPENGEVILAAWQACSAPG
jgi:hypothetical protein